MGKGQARGFKDISSVWKVEFVWGTVFHATIQIELLAKYLFPDNPLSDFQSLFTNTDCDE